MIDEESVYRYFDRLGCVGVRRVWLRDDIYTRVFALFFHPNGIPDDVVPTICGVMVYPKAARRCVPVHTWTHNYGDDWTPEPGTPCDCRRKKWGANQ